MDEKFLISLGLSQNQARTYRALVLKKCLRPSQLAKLISESRSNCYALLDRLVTLGLATKSDENKKFTYYPASPVALKALLDKQLGEVEQQLQALERRLPQMLSDYHAGGEQPKIVHHRGKKELAAMYTEQMEQPGTDLYFVRSRADIPYFGLKPMQDLRYLTRTHGYKKRRYGVTPIVFGGPMNKRVDASANLKRAWVLPERYDAPVEWAVAGNQVQAIVFKGEGYGVTINHPEIAESFRQIMQLLFEAIHKDPDYDQLPKIATR